MDKLNQRLLDKPAGRHCCQLQLGATTLSFAKIGLLPAAAK